LEASGGAGGGPAAPAVAVAGLADVPADVPNG
jgi:hypothetical protein